MEKGCWDGLIAGTEPLTKKVLKRSCRLSVISRVGVGLENIDLDFAKKQGIKVFNTPALLTESVAELTLGLILSCLRKIAIADNSVRRKQWRKEMGSLLEGKIIGIIGFGHIGKRVAQLLRAFKAKAIFYDISRKTSSIATRVPLSTLLKESDIISLHVSGKKKIIGGREFKMVKKGVIFINTSRGSALDEAALVRALCSGIVAGAGLDVFEREPYKGKLAQFGNCILTPHIGSYAKEARIQMEIKAVENLLKGLSKL